ncbi:sulfurtransferase complex subunit TusB [Marinagarivorans algicola]|uniref:sulfurtransferase complex subunit TusB n=1 Tax=Marinagarivorans algicola TaxID=1513270 RepID=UPI0006B578EA|nr:sulfurtransferase complex subunit TusB [Marinagarivorans algicola]
MTLHIVSQNNPFVLKNCLAVAGPNDALVFINDGVYALATHAALVKRPLTYALAHDITTRGLTLNHLIEPLSYSQFVALSCQYNPVQSWY